MDDKRLLRASVLAARAARSGAEREQAGRLLAAHGITAARGCAAVAAHVGVDAEPPTRPLLEALVAQGVRVLLPAVDGTALSWGELRDWADLRRSPLGLLEPAETSAAAAAAAEAGDLLLVPALAVDRQGHRLGRGGGFYDRWLEREPAGRVVAVVYDDEVLPAVPHELHDRLVAAALTPSGLVALGQ